MQKNRFLTLLLSGALVVTVATGGALLTTGEASLTSGVSTAAPPPRIAQAVPTTTTLTTTPASTAPEGTEVTLTATIMPITAAGTVQFQDGPTPIGRPLTVTPDGTVSGKTSKLSVGAHQLSAVFTPANAALHSPSTSTPVPFMVTASSTSSTSKDTSTELTTSPVSPVPQNTQVTLNAAVTPVEAAGAVQFRNGTTPIGGPAPVSNGKASVITSNLPVGSHQLTAVFTPTDTATYNPSTSKVVTFEVTDGTGVTATNTVVTTSPPSPVAQGNPVTIDALVTPTAAAGTVQFKDGPNPLGGAVTVSNGKASVSTSTLPVGSHQLTATFTPSNATYGPSASQPITLVITAAAAPTATTTTLMVVPDFPIPEGVPVLLRASVVPDADGKIQFQNGTKVLGEPVPVILGSATRILTTLEPGTHSLVAVFIPTNPATYGPSTSPTVPLTVTGGVGNSLLEQIIIEVQKLIQDVLEA